MKSNMKSTKLKINKKHRGEIMEALTLMSQLGLMVATSILIGLFVGRFLDERLGTSPWIMLILILGGTVAAFHNIYITVTKRWK